MNEVADRNNVLKLENDTLQQTVRQVTTLSQVDVTGHLLDSFIMYI